MACFQKKHALARNADPTRKFVSIYFSREKALARNADPRRIISLWDSVSCRRKPLARNGDARQIVCFFFQNMLFPEDTNARNADPRPVVFSREFSSYPKAPARDFNPRRIVLVWDLLARRKGSCKER